MHLRLCLALLIASLPTASTVQAEPGDQAFSVAPFASMRSLTPKDSTESVSYWGGGLAFQYERGIHDSWWLHTQLDALALRRNGQSFQLASIAAGLAYRLDVLKWVPQLHGLAGVRLGDTFNDPKSDFYWEAGLNVDRLRGRGASHGPGLRYRRVIGNSDWSIHFSYRYSWRWGFF